MGGGSYSSKRYAVHSVAMNYASLSREQIFKERSINNAMSPHGVTVRESRDSAEHPNSLAIIIALDVTGSMGSVPHYLVKEGFPKIMDRIIQSGVQDPQVLFLGIGDHECDNAPLQVSQFESSDELLDKWLTSVYLEGGGGGNAGESYALAWYFAAQHTSIDCLEKRGQKGILFTIGDEPALLRIPKPTFQHLMGDGQHQDFDASALLQKAMEKYHVFHIHIRETASGSRHDRIDHWRQLIQDNLLVAERHEDVAGIISEKILTVLGKTESQVQAAAKDAPQKPAGEEDML